MSILRWRVHRTYDRPMSREEAIRILVTHPAVVEVLDAPQPGEPDSGMLMLRLEDEQVNSSSSLIL